MLSSSVKRTSSKCKSVKCGKNQAGRARQNALLVLKRVAEGVSLSALQAELIAQLEDSRDRALCHELVYGVLRWQLKLDALLQLLLQKALKQKDLDIQCILRLALYELLECRTPDYAVINDAVLLVRNCRKNWASGLVNGVLRNFLRERENLLSKLEDEVALYSHPAWMQQKISQDWPEHWQQILLANNQQAPLWLRVNTLQSTRDAYIKRLSGINCATQTHPFAGQAIKLMSGVEVTTLPGFSQGAVSVQDAGAQLAASLLLPTAGQRVLDLCAAPGGKSCHLLETSPQIKLLVTVELSASRMLRVEENLARLQLTADCVVSDARTLASQYENGYFDRILIDAPCSASGVIRRHPDIKSLRRETDPDALCELQAEILANAWPLLAVGGQLLYVTCSVFRQENQQQIERFLANNADAKVLELDVEWGLSCSVGRQLLPGDNDADGFYFCLLKKKER